MTNSRHAIFILFFSFITLVLLPGLLHARTQALELTPRIEVNPPQVTFAANVRAWLDTHPVIRVGIWGVSQPPVSLGLERGQLAGVDADYLALLQSAMNVHFDLVHYQNREEAIAALNQGEVCMLAIWNPDLMPHQKVNASLPWLNDRAVLVTRAGQDARAAAGSLPLLALNSQHVPEERHSPDAFEDYYHVINSVAFGQTAAAGISQTTARYLARNNQLENLWLLPHPAMGEFTLTFGVPRHNPQLLSAINNVLTHLPLVSRLRIAQGWGLENETVVGQSSLSLTAAEAAWHRQNPTMTVLLDARREPFSFLNLQEKATGLAVDVLRQICQRFGLQFHYEVAQNDDELTALFVKYPEAVLATSLSIHGEPEAANVPMKESTPWLTTPAVLVMKRSNAQPATLHELSGEKIAIRRDNPLIPWLGTWYPTLQLIQTDTLQQALEQVANGEAHGAIAPQFSAQYHLNRDTFSQLHQSLSLPVKPYSASFASQRDDSPALGILNKALQQLPPARLMSLASGWQDNVRPADTATKTYLSPILISISMLAGLVVILLVGWWIGRLSQSLKTLRERLSSNQALIVQLQEAKAETERALQVRNAFMKSMGHEIRTPLNAITGLLELELERLHRQQQHNENLQTVYESACSLLSITGDVFDIFRAEARDEQSRIRVVNLPSLLRSTVALFQQQAEEKGLHINVAIEPQTPWVEFDPLLLIRIVSSLLRNAIKHCTQGEITLTLSLEDHGKSGHPHFVIAVKNAGQGTLAQRWTDLQQAPLREHDPRVWADTGFSLAACLRMATDAGASLNVESQRGEADCVSLHFTAALMPQGVSALESPQKPRALKVMIVDDYPPARLLLSQQLKKAGCEVLTAVNGKEGLTLWQQYHQEIGMVITDCTMPEMDGFEMSRAIRAAEICNKLPHTPIYALTAMSSFDAAEDCKDAGIDACFTKPIATDALRQILACCTRTKETAC